MMRPDHGNNLSRSVRIATGLRACIAAATLLAGMALLIDGGNANEQASANLQFFEKKIRPVLVEHCYGCHSATAEDVQGGLLLDTRAGIRHGGDSGPSVTPGKPAESLLLDAIRYGELEMPPDAKLPNHVIADFEQWIVDGATDPREGEVRRASPTIDLEQGRRFWAFQSPRHTPPPEVQDVNWPRTDVDHYILAKLEAAGLRPAPDADRNSVLRRIYFALIGLPPKPHELQAFSEDPSSLAEATARVIDRLLDSEHFGQRWGRHWLDVVRYADSSGGGRSAIFSHAWRYRDYVIDALNSDMPYNRFLQEQLAGDLMDSTDWRQRRRQITATGFLVLGPTNFELQDKEVLEMDIVDEQLDTIGKAFMGMTIGCARCHDHKFDPLPARDYYAMAGILKSTKSVLHDNVSTGYTTNLPLSPAVKLELTIHNARIAGLKKERDVLQATHKQLAETQSPASITADVAQHSLQHAALMKRLLAVKKQLRELEATGPKVPVAMSVDDQENVGDIPLAIRGVVHNRGAIVPRGVLQVCSNAEFTDIPNSESGRKQLAQWITDPRHPLTARVMVNRVWYWLFGEGLVRTVDNFGATGDKPSHAELLDYLALRFMEEGWSVKSLIRQIMLSRAYCMSTVANDDAIEVDPENRLLWRMHRQRLDAESIRDAMLLVGVYLDLTAGGPTIAPDTKSEYGYVFQGYQRSVYLPVFRNRLPELFEVFDFADPNIQTGWRANSTTAPQANYLMNHPFVMEMSEAAATRLVAQPEKTREARLRRVYQQVLGRSPTKEEAQLAARFLGDTTEDVRRWGMLYQSLFQSVDFRYLN